MDRIQFHSKAVNYSEFSNFYEAQFELDGKIWKTVEHYFQHEKFPGNTILQEKIWQAKTPASAKQLGKTRAPTFRRDWNDVRDEVMKSAVEAKFQQNPTLLQLLLETGSTLLEEKSPFDSYWGTGRTGKGQNKMGQILMELRSKTNQSRCPYSAPSHQLVHQPTFPDIQYVYQETSP